MVGEMSRPIKPIEDWLNEIEGFGLRQERLYDEVKPGDFPALIRWLEAAYLEGNKAAREDFYRDFSPSDIEKVTGIPDTANHFAQAGARSQALLLPAVSLRNGRSLSRSQVTVSAFGRVLTKPAPSTAATVWHPLKAKLTANIIGVHFANFRIVLRPLLEQFVGSFHGSRSFCLPPFFKSSRNLIAVPHIDAAKS